jgi:hypothetical protein
MATLKEYLVLCQIAYNDFDIENERKFTIGELLKLKSSLNKYINDDKNKIWKKHFKTIEDWTLINCQTNTKSGFAAAAFRSPAGELVIAFRGTEPSWKTALQDFGTDAKIYTGWDDEMIGQFRDAKAFVCQTLGINSLDQINKNKLPKFAGHSLGGGLADYLAYLTDATSTTFNAVGFAQCLPTEELKHILNNRKIYRKRINDYCDAWDMIGNSGVHIGEKIYLINDQTLDAPYYVSTTTSVTNSWDYLNNYLNNYFEDLWNSAVYQCENNIDKAKDFFKKLINSYIPITGLATGSPYSHGLTHFLNDINADESLIKSNVVGSSEVKYYQEISKILQILNIGGRADKKAKETVIKTVKEVIKKAVK